jgi:hypothetical protein
MALISLVLLRPKVLLEGMAPPAGNVRRSWRAWQTACPGCHLHLHLLMSEPQDRTPSTVMQAMKLG